MRRVSTKIFLTFAVALAPFGMVAGFGISRLHDLGRDLRLLSEGYLPLTRIAAQIDVKDWVTSRVLEARALDPASRRAYLPVARAHFPALVREKIAEGREVARRALAFAGKRDARFLGDVAAKLDALDVKWAQYDAAASALFDVLERGDGERLEQRVQGVRTLEKGLSLDVKLLAVALENQIGDRVHAAERAESRTVAAIIIYSLLAAAIGLGAVVISQRLLAPIRTLTEGVKAVAAGDLTRKVEARSDDEIGVLAREFNAMAASLERQRHELLRAERLAAVGRISAHITHEIRNPLNAIGLNTELLAEEIERIERAEEAAPERAEEEAGSARRRAEAQPKQPVDSGGLHPPVMEARALVAAIGREVDRLNGVAEEYLRFARLPRPQLAREDLNEILSGLLEFIAPEMAAANVELRRELAAQLPPVLADESQLRAAFLNLLRNSREAMPQGGAVIVRTRALDGSVEAEVGDTGGGIPPGELSRIFDPFYSTKERGTGLGLAFTQQVVQEHGGTIGCRSQVGQGTVFEVRIPAAPEEREPVAIEEAASA
jgi:two-component system NtrC family sensor kinase